VAIPEAFLVPWKHEFVSHIPLFQTAKSQPSSVIYRQYGHISDDIPIQPPGFFLIIPTWWFVGFFSDSDPNVNRDKENFVLQWCYFIGFSAALSLRQLPHSWDCNSCFGRTLWMDVHSPARS
jgi:hypothetical protein